MLRRILFVSPFDESLSGADESLLLAVSALDRRRFEPHVLLPDRAPYNERYRRAGIQVHEFPLSRMRRSYRPHFWLDYVLKLRSELRQLPKFLEEMKINVVHLNMHVALGPLLAAHRLKIPVVVHYRAKTNDTPKTFFDLFLPFLHRHAAAVLCISEAVARHFQSRGLSDHVFVLHNPVDLSRFTEKVSASPWANDPNFREKKVALYVGRIHPQKRVHIFLDALESAFQSSPEWAGVIVGEAAQNSLDMAYDSELNRRIQAMKAPIRRFSNTKEIASFMQNAHVLVLPSVHEGFGRVLVEGMAAGVPVIGARSGAIPEVLAEGRRGQLFEADNPKDLEACIRRVDSDPHIKSVVAHAKQHVWENFSIERHAAKLMDIYDKCLR